MIFCLILLRSQDHRPEPPVFNPRCDYIPSFELLLQFRSRLIQDGSPGYVPQPAPWSHNLLTVMLSLLALSLDCRSLINGISALLLLFFFLLLLLSSFYKTVLDYKTYDLDSTCALTAHLSSLPGSAPWALGLWELGAKGALTGFPPTRSDCRS